MTMKTKDCELSRGGNGLRADIEGNIWVGAWGGEGFDGVHVFAPDGQRIGLILLPDATSNICFGGLKRNAFLSQPANRFTEFMWGARAHMLLSRVSPKRAMRRFEFIGAARQSPRERS